MKLRHLYRCFACGRLCLLDKFQRKHSLDAVIQSIGGNKNISYDWFSIQSGALNVLAGQAKSFLEGQGYTIKSPFDFIDMSFDFGISSSFIEKPIKISRPMALEVT